MKFLIFLLALPLLAIDGRVINRTTGKPQAGATVTVYKLGAAGIESLETVKSDAAGNFSFTADPGPGPSLLQGAWDGVTYNKMLTPNTPRAGVEVDVWNSQSKPGDAKVTQHMLLFEPAGGKLLVNENIIYQNPGLTSYNDPDNGAFRFYLPPEAGGKVKIECTAPQGMAIERAATPTKIPNVYGVDFPIKPGETRFHLTYELPAASPAVFTGRILHKEGTTRLVTPKGVTLEGEGVRELGREPATEAAIYSLTGQNLKVKIEGTGSMSDASAPSDEEGPGIQEILPRVYGRVYIVLGLAAAILALGFVVLYRGPITPQVAPHSSSPSKEKRRA